MFNIQNQNKEAVHHIKNFDFLFSDLTDEKLVPIIKLLMDARDVLSQHIFDVWKTRQKFDNKLEPGTTLEETEVQQSPSISAGKIRKTSHTA